MPIDWFTVTAQIVNFVVLVWILKRFLYRPVLATMAARQKRVEETMLAAGREKDEAARERVHYEEELRKLDSDREATLSQAKREAEAERSRLIERARDEAHSLRQRWREGLRKQQDDLSGELASRVQREAIGLAGTMVRDLADADLQGLIARQFIQKLRNLASEDRQGLVAPPDATNQEAVLRSAFDPGDDLRDELEQVARSLIGDQTPIRFETKPSLGAGFELAVNGQKAAWTVDNYLTSIEANLRKLMERETAAHDQ